MARSGRIVVLNRPICSLRNFSVSDLKSNGLAGLKGFIWSNLCTRHIPKRLTQRGHEDWPDKSATRTMLVPKRRSAKSPTTVGARVGKTGLRHASKSRLGDSARRNAQHLTGFRGTGSWQIRPNRAVSSMCSGPKRDPGLNSKLQASTGLRDRYSRGFASMNNPGGTNR